MKHNTRNITTYIILVTITTISQPFLQTHATTTCDRSCGTTKHIPYPFGFSSGCHIPLTCSANGTISIGDFPVQKVTGNTILVDLQAECGRPVRKLRQLFTKNFSPTSHNGILLQNCTTPVTGCLIPTTMVQTHLEMLECDTSINVTNNNNSTKNGTSSSNDTISCYSEQRNESLFIDYDSVIGTSCKWLISAISTETYGNSSAVSLDVQVVQLGWWLHGTCQCSDHATCTMVISPVDGKDGYRCQCNDGFAGDGFRAGSGCRKGMFL